MVGIRDADTKIVKAEWALNWLTFVFTRVVPRVLIPAKLVRDVSKFDKGMELHLALNDGLGFDLLAAFKRENKPPVTNHVDSHLQGSKTKA